ncbi:SufS family cysteine desulfurase [Candidatus Woesearchaeota archaeon]|nr:SufS family cysteine desulfurase [Candidatus Woesearchaeota archaeon]
MNKEDFPLLHEHPNLVYLDNSATTQKPLSVINALVDFYKNTNSNVHRGIHFLSQKATMEYQKAHEAVADFIGAEAEEIVFTSGTTQSLNLIARMLGRKLREDDEIVLTEMEHHSNIIPWQQIAKEKKCGLKYIPLTSGYTLDMKEARQMINSKTRIVAVTHVSNVLGTINPVRELASLAHDVGALLIVDGAQSAPHLKINVKDLGCDFFAFSGHKMCGPTGIGVLYGKKGLLQNLDPVEFGGGMIKEVTKWHATWADLPAKFEAGTPNIAGAVGLRAAIDYLNNIGMEKIQEQGRELMAYALQKLSLLPKVRIIGPVIANERIPVFSFTVDKMHPHDVGDFLDKHNIAVRAGHHCAMPLMKTLGINGTVRASFYFYNTLEDVDKLISALHNLLNSKMENVSLRNVDKNQIVFGELTEKQEIYKENVLDHYKEPRNKGILKEYTHSCREVNPVCGDVVTLYLNVENEKIQNVSFMGNGCVISQASLSLLTEEMKGKPVQMVQNFTLNKIFSLLGIPISHTRYTCAFLSLKAVHGALKNGLRN